MNSGKLLNVVASMFADLYIHLVSEKRLSPQHVSLENKLLDVFPLFAKMSSEQKMKWIDNAPHISK